MHSMDFDPFASSEYMPFSGPSHHHTLDHPASASHLVHHHPTAHLHHPQQHHDFQQHQHSMSHHHYHYPEHRQMVHPQQQRVLLAHSEGFSDATHAPALTSSNLSSMAGDSSQGAMRGDDVSSALVAEKTMEKRRANAEAARRSRQRRAQKIADIADRVAIVESENSELLKYVTRLETEKKLWIVREKELKAQNAALQKKLDAAFSTTRLTLGTSSGSSSSETLNELPSSPLQSPKERAS